MSSSGLPYHSYIFFDTAPALRPLSSAAFQKAKREFAAVLANANDVESQSYATLGFKADTRFMLHLCAASPEAIQDVLSALLHTALGARLRISYTLFGMKRRSQYKPGGAPEESKPEAPHKYLVVYPFTKTIEWHLLPFDERRSIMKAHVDVGRKFSSSISQLLLYAFGVDDHEFIVSYYTDALEDFQTLVMELRGTEARRYTENDTPIFTCIHKPLAQCLDLL